jgi:adenosylcobinamide hydrolase
MSWNSNRKGIILEMNIKRLKNGTSPLEGITFELIHSEQGPYLLWKSLQPLRTLNSSPWGGGFGHHTCLFNRQVDKNYQAVDPIEEMNCFLQSEGLRPDETAGMLTAAWVRDAGIHTELWADEEKAEQEQMKVCTYVTVGLSNKARAGNPLLATALYPGTINTIVLIHGTLTDAAMVNAVITATEAKTAALADLGICMDTSDGGRPATGTTTDAVLIAANNRGSFHSYAGTATQLGYCIGRAVYESIMVSGKKYPKATN